ncbi:MAG: RNA 2',3'-cyclic phosphodiesterase [Calditrichaeota bacterium]|nr:MAG: RNA 2',3'-cyclic phosphodiesterase [Calditrichota bacterium]
MSEKNRSVERLFLAIYFPERILNRMEQDARALRCLLNGNSLRWVTADKRHLTLLFLGDTPRDLRDRLIYEWEKALSAFPAFSISSGRFDFFPSRGRPRVLYLGLGDCPSLHELVRRIRCVYTRHLPQKTMTPFKAHITLARMPQRMAAPVDKQLIRETQPTPWVTTAPAFHLIRSRLTNRCPQYTIVHTFPLRPNK